MLKPIPIELILAAQQLVTDFGQAQECLSYSGYKQDGTAYIHYYAKIARTARPRVIITSSGNETVVEVHLSEDHHPMTGTWTEDYEYFISLINRHYTPEQFLEVTKQFWTDKGKIGLDLF